MTRTEKFLIALDQTLGQVLFGDIYPDETISAYVWRTRKTGWIRFINWLFRSPTHCWVAYESEHNGSQQAPDYRAKFDEESA